MIIVYTTGVFDLLHPGHLNLLKRARALGDKLIVGVQEDNSVEEQKGKKPIMNCEQRMAMLEALPFVDVVLPYNDLDQRKMLELLKPNIMVQGGDWLKSGDRTIIIQYLKDNNIKLIQFPYTNGISSTEIKERVYSDLKKIKLEKSLEFNFYQRLKLVPIDNLLVYEDFSPARTDRLINNISAGKTFFNPLTVGDIGEKNKYLVIDGANRLEALKRLKATYAFIQIINYLNPEEVELRANEHFLNCTPTIFLNLLAQAGISLKPAEEFEPLAPAVHKVKQNTMIYLDNKQYFLADDINSNLENKISQLNKFVSSYKDNFIICRKSEAGDVSKNYPITIKFNKFTTSDIVEIAHKYLHLESGITWHVTNNSVIRFKIPFKLLADGFSGEPAADLALHNIIDNKIKNLSIRRYLSNIYVCDEWEI